MTVDDILKPLKQLGSTPDKVAEKLMKLDLRGRRCWGGGCPVAVYLQRKFPHAEVGVSEKSATVYRSRTENKVAELPEAVAEFIRAFDSGKAYQDLCDITENPQMT